MNADPTPTSRQRFLARRIAAFRYAFAGLAYVLRTQPNAWIHGIITLIAVLLSLWLDLSRSEWGLIIVTIAIVWTTEILNTAIEATIDLVSPQPHPLARIAKDCAAAAVLITAVTAVIIGMLLLGPKLWDRLG